MYFAVLEKGEGQDMVQARQGAQAHHPKPKKDIARNRESTVATWRQTKKGTADKEKQTRKLRKKWRQHTHVCMSVITAQ